jgi:hypothetical protein
MYSYTSFKQVATRLFPVMLSLLVAVSATATAGVSIAKSPTPTHKTAKPKPGTTPAKKAEPKSPEAKKTEDAAKEAKDKAALDKEIEASLATAAKAEPLTILKEPTQYLNKKITFTGTFNRFADIALDYKKAFRDSRDYVTFFILRPDVSDHTIPLAEMKLFFPRKKSTEVMDLETGDKIQIIGTEFSTALDEPWIDVEHIKILEKTEKHERKHQPEF